jgi:hypothetical protein
MQDGTLYHALEAGRGFGVLTVFDRERREILVDIFGEPGPKRVEIDIAGAHDLGGIRIVDQREQEMFQRRIFMMAFAGEPDRPVQRLFQTAG